MYFFDTNALLNLRDKAFAEPFYISVVTLRELEDIKTSGKKTQEVRAQAREVVRLMEQHWDMVKLATFAENDYCLFLKEQSLADTNDNRILHDCCYMQLTHAEQGDEPIYFVTYDLCCKALARALHIETAEFVGVEEEIYTGYQSISLNEEAMAAFYSDLADNKWNLKINEYLRVLNADGELVDVRKWDGSKYVDIYNKSVKSIAMGAIKPRDEYQRMAIDSINNNTLTILSGKAGSGKSLIALATICSMIEKTTCEYDRVVIMTNPCKVRGSVDMGFYTGDAQKKLMQNSLGNILITKFGDRFMVDNMISQDKLKIMSIADCRGMEVRDNEILYISESQNMSVDMIKLVLERASQGCKVVLDGDFDAQVDSWAYEGSHNGMKRAVEKFKGNPLFGYVDLPNVWRSKLAEMAQSL